MVTKEQTISSRAPAGRSLAHVRRNDDGSFVIHGREEQLRAVEHLGEKDHW